MPVIPIAEPRLAPKTPPRGFALFALGFRPFYLLAAILAVVLVPLWISVLAGSASLAPVLPALLWHGHEMLFGFACAVIVGFLFTAGHNWTGLATPSGKPLAALAVLWLLGRLAMFSGSPPLAALLDLSFLPVAGVMLGRVLVRAQSRRNYFVLVILAVLTAANALVHAGAHGWIGVSPLNGLHLAVALVTVLETVIAGRIVPNFTANALRTVPWRNVYVDRLAIGATAVALLLWALAAPAGLTAAVAALAAIVQAVRVWGWCPLPTLRAPLLWILHLSHAWIIVALAVLAAAGAGWMDARPALHLLTVGATGGLIIGMITRTALGHTGRLLKAGAVETACYVLLQAAVVLRVLPMLGLPAATYLPFMWVSAIAWSACFALYLWRYAAILINPRVDGRPG